MFSELEIRKEEVQNISWKLNESLDAISMTGIQRQEIDQDISRLKKLAITEFSVDIAKGSIGGKCTCSKCNPQNV